jgi:hypothetical protein
MRAEESAECFVDCLDRESAMEALHASGLLSRPQSTLNVAAFIAAARPVAPASGSLRDAILEERKGGQ